MRILRKGGEIGLSRDPLSRDMDTEIIGIPEDLTGACFGLADIEDMPF